MINIVHISDIHYTCTVPSEQSLVISAFIDDLKIQLQNLDLPDNYLLISGDLVYTGNRDNYTALANDILKNLELKCHIPREKILFVPGNHDVDREFVDRKYIELKGYHSPLNEADFNNLVNQEEFTDLAIYKKFIPFENFAHKYNSNIEIDGSLHKIGDNVAVLCINTALCSFGGARNINDIGDLKILNINTRKLNRLVKEVREENRLPIFLMHHPIEDLSTWSNTELKSIVKSLGKSLVLSGHTHDQEVANIHVDDSSIIYVHSPQLFCNDKSEILGYSIITIDDDNKSIQTIKYRQWSNKRRKFVAGVDFADEGIRTFDSRSLLSKRSSDDKNYEKIAEQLLNDNSLITDNYIYVIRGLEQLKSYASNNPRFIFDFLCKYIQKRTSIESSSNLMNEIAWLRMDNDTKLIKSQPYDVQLAFNMLYKDCINEFANITDSIDFTGLALQNISFIGMTVRNTDFSRSFIQHASMFYIEDLEQQSIFKNCSFDNSFLDASNMTRCKFEDCSFNYTNFRWANFYGASLQNCKFVNCNMTGVILSEINSSMTSFFQCDIDASEILKINSKDKTIFKSCTFCFASIFSKAIVEDENISCEDCNWAGSETDIRYYENHGRIKRLLIYEKNIFDHDQIRSSTGRLYNTGWKMKRYFSILKTIKDYCLPNGVDEIYEIEQFVNGNQADILSRGSGK